MAPQLNCTVYIQNLLLKQYETNECPNLDVLASGIAVTDDRLMCVTVFKRFAICCHLFNLLETSANVKIAEA